MSQINFLRVSIIFLLSSLLAACQPLDFAKIKPNFSKIKEKLIFFKQMVI